MLKRAVDLVLAAAGLLLLAPLGLAIALWIRLDSPGPVFFRQARVGRGGALFSIHKFRTMSLEAARTGPALTVGDDARITRAGHWLRRSKLDELPQLIDVVKGDMSLVGPRPEVPAFVALYPHDLRAKLLSVRPGITDPASLAFADESARLAHSPDPQQAYVDEVLPAKLALSAAYVDRMSLREDLRLLFATARRIWWR